MKAIQIVDLTGPDSALELVDLPEPEPTHMLSPGAGVLVDVHCAGVAFPELLQTRGEYQIKPPLPFVPGSEVAGVVRSAPAGATVEGRRPCGGVLRARRVRRDRGGAPVPHVRAARGARLRAGRGPDPQLPHRLLLAGPARAAARGRDGARPRRRRRRGHRGAAGREGPRRAHDRGRLERCQGAGRAGGRRRSRRALRRAVEGRGEGALRRRRGGRVRPGRRRALHRQPALAARGRPPARGGVRRWVDPRGEGQPAAARQHRGDRRRLGWLRDGPPGGQPGDRRRHQRA